MRFIHMADIHLGMAPDSGKNWSAQRKEEMWETFRRCIEEAHEEEIDLVLIAGDLFHGEPQLRQLKELNYIFKKADPVEIVLIAGNHDYISSTSAYREIEWCDNVHMLMSDDTSYIYIPHINTCVQGFSYHKREIILPLIDDMQPAGKSRYNDAIQILVAHGGDSAHIPIDYKKLENSGFEYVALGHIHKRSGGRNWSYSGSLEPTDRNDIGQKGYILGEIDGVTKELSYSFVACSKRQYVTLKFRCLKSHTSHEVADMIRKKIYELGEFNIYTIELTGTRHMGMEGMLLHLLSDLSIIEIINNTDVEYDYDKLRIDMKGTIVEEVIEQIGENQQALQYAVSALMSTMD